MKWAIRALSVAYYAYLRTPFHMRTLLRTPVSGYNGLDSALKRAPLAILYRSIA